MWGRHWQRGLYPHFILTMGQGEVLNIIEKEKIVTINEIMGKTNIAKRSLQQSLSRMVGRLEIQRIKVKSGNRIIKYYIENDICFN